MIVLVEAYAYQPDDLAGLIDPQYLMPATVGRVKLNYVGYLAEAGQKHSVIILPKVFLSHRAGRDYIFDTYTPEDLLTLPADDPSPIRERLRAGGQLDVLFRFSVWLYRAIRQFRQRQPDSILYNRVNLLDVSTTGDSALSELEIVLALVRFHRDNNTLLTHIKRVSTAQRHTVSWSRTVARQQPILQNGRPIYAEPVVKQKHINYDEELLVLYLSTLDDLRRQYGFRLELNPLYPLLPAREFERFRTRATRRLREIRGKYFSDKLLRVWQLLFMYYDRQEKMRPRKVFREVLLIRDFNVVFEDMIDYLLADPKDQLPNGLKDQPDGKIVDHIYDDASLLLPDHIYHIGDSKYYKDGNLIDWYSVSKQFTYARNVIQANVDLLNQDQPNGARRYRDALTEGYNPTPNFFISAVVGELDFSRAGLDFQERDSYPDNHHFAGRLFDRDTLLLQAYNINFLYVLNAYVAGSGAERARFRRDTRQGFRSRLIQYLNQTYDFYRVTPTAESLDEFVTRHFRNLIGKMYRPSDFTDAILVAYPAAKPVDLGKLFGELARVEPYELA